MMKYLVKHRFQLLMGLAIVALALWLQVGGTGWAGNVVKRLDNLAYDIRLNLTLPPPFDKQRVYIIDIDDESLRAEGRWPWSREKMAVLVANLKALGVQTVGFDVAFTEPERNIAQELLETTGAEGGEAYRGYLEELVPLLDRDALFGGTLKGQNVVLGFLFHAHDEPPAGKLPSPWYFVPDEQAERLSVPTMSTYTGNLSGLQRAARNGGFLNTTPDLDGVIRSTPLVLRNGQMIYPSLSLAMARNYLGAKRFALETADLGPVDSVTGLRLDDRLVPTDLYGRVLVPYLGAQGEIPYIPATRILQARDVSEFPQLNGALAIVGTSAIGLADLVITPTDRSFPGVEVHATILETILNERPFPSEPDWADAANALAILATGLLLALSFPALGALSITLCTALALGVVVGADLWLWRSAHLSLSPVIPLLTVLGIATVNVLYGFFAEARQKRQVRKAFSSYMAPALVDQLVDDPDKLSLTGENREMTFLFSDIAGFTSFTEKATPELLVQVLNEYLDAMCRVVMDHGGTIDKIVGDAVVGIWNAPLDQPDHADRAVSCALEMRRVSVDFVERMHERGYPFGNTRVGVNTGEAIVGNFGGSERFDYTAHGDPINTAARMESVNKHLGTLVCISGTTVAQSHGFHFRPIGGLVLKGKTESIDAFEPITAEEADTELAQRYQHAFDLLDAGDERARDEFRHLREDFPDDPLVTLHGDRIEAGILSTTIVLDEK